MNEFLKNMRAGTACKCPKCMKGSLYPSTFDLTLNKACGQCGLDLERNDSADGPAVLLIFVLGALLVPLALLFDHVASPPLWVHAILWTAITLAMTIGALKPIKSYIIYLQYKHRKTDWD